MSSGSHLSKEFFELIKAIGESKSKQEEDRIIQREIITLKKKLETPTKTPSVSSKLPLEYNSSVLNPLQQKNSNLLTNKKKSKEFLVRLLYVEMLGHDGSFGYIKAVELAAATLITHKRTGYLLCGACLSPDNEFRFMLVNQMQRDLNSANVLETCASLYAITRIITSDMVPAVANDVQKMLAHASENVRKKSIIALHRLYKLNPDAVPRMMLIEQLRRVLCDRDPSVMGASLCVIESMAATDSLPFKDLVSSLVSILKQICEHRLPSEFDYHRMPAPWMQMQILRILSILGKNDANASSGMYEIINDCLKRADIGINAGYAVVYECIKTITTIYPNPVLLDAAAESISRFIGSRSNNLKFLGVTGLASIVEKHPQYAAAHQMAVIECLEDRDETLQRKTLDLLYRMTNPVNVEFITEKLLDFLRSTTDPFLRKDLTTRISNIAERYAPSNAWYVHSVTSLFEISGDLVKPEVAHNLMSLIAEGSGDEEDEESDMALRQNAVELGCKLISKPNAKLPKILAETMAWVLGEYAYLSAEYDIEQVLEMLCNLAKRSSSAPSTRCFLISAIMKLVAQLGTCPPNAAHVIDNFTKSNDGDLQQRCLEFQNMLTSVSHILGEAFPVDASCEDVEADETLSHLNDFVQAALMNGSAPYSPPDDDDDDDYATMNAGTKKPAFNFTQYEKPSSPQTFQPRNMDSSSMQEHNTGFGDSSAVLGGMSGFPAAADNCQPNPAGQSTSKEPSLILHNVANVWGKQPDPAPAPFAGTSAPTPSFGNTPGPANSFGSQSSSQTEEASKPHVPSEKERMAAALFGGVPGVPTASVPTSSSGTSFRNPKSTTSAPAISAPVAAPVPTPIAVPAPTPTPIAEVDLLDMGFGDVSSSAVPDVLATPGTLDMLSPTLVLEVNSEKEPSPTPAITPIEVDPFAASGLLGDVADAPLGVLAGGGKFEYNGSPLLPLPISTQQFGQNWGTCSSTNPISVVSSKVVSLNQMMDILVKAGAHKIEAIAATNEGIAGGSIGGTSMVLIHGNVIPQIDGSSQINVTVKSKDGSLSGNLAAFLSNMLR
eukprot:CAMPEP_0194355278 /NCGR_PEP_ID=MMETSP0174-20130528/3214_1 /TAXON_ID=216777 /ORGANISM="Proboscia alata, Strain PI-D3" /LENGTH=1060 /DNA_ID=CAMNT_0039124499 /DNA_START=84 /DNA_END=3266 /DNA_ORIENTATION=+